jgi:hypothetical protein
MIWGARGWLGAALLAARMTTACASSTPNPVATACAPGPADVYLQYEQKLAQAKSLEEIVPFLSNQARERVEQVSPYDRSTLLQRMQEAAPKDVRVDGVHITSPDRAALDVEGTKEVANGTPAPARAKVQMVQELGRWRVHQEDWTPSTPPDRAPAPETPPP